jgi:hypothetical protein
MPTPTTLRAAALAALLLVTGRAAGAQVAAAAGVPPGCTYQTCALRLEQGWGMRIVRGAEGQRVGKVGGFGTGVGVLLAGPDSARVHAQRFQGASRVASTLGLISAAAWVYSAVRYNRNGEDDDTAQIVALAGTGVGLISIPFAWRAQRGLSRSVWWYNAALPR